MSALICTCPPKFSRKTLAGKSAWVCDFYEVKMTENVVLYRKYRPQSFAEIIGQEHIVKTLQNSITLGSISHAYLFCGPRGSGKTTIARIFAKAINCSSSQVLPKGKISEDKKPKDAEPCNKCDSCQEIMAGKSIDLIEIDAASHTGVDDVRALIDGLKFAPVKSKYKIFIIDECHQLSKDASNALLKTLEEPPSHVIFMLATTEPHKMLSTIISRCQRFDFKKLQIPEIIKKVSTTDLNLFSVEIKKPTPLPKNNTIVGIINI